MRCRNIFTPFHPFLIGVYPVLALMAANLGQGKLCDAGRSLVAALILATLVLLTGQMLLRDGQRAAILTSACLILFHSYGHAYRVVEGLRLGGVLVGRHRYLLAASAILLIIVWTWLRRGTRWAQLTLALNLSALFLVAMPALQMGGFGIRQWLRSHDRQTSLRSETPMLSPGIPAMKPDIYYIILDEYARADVLRQSYDYDNSGFLAFLESRGFVVLAQSRANYAQTELSLAASLNLEYVQTLSPELTPDNQDRSPLAVLIQQNRVRRLLEGAGYKTVAFTTGFGWSEWTDADWYFEPRLTMLDRARYLGIYNSFEATLVGNSMALIAAEALQDAGVDAEFPYRMRRLTVLNTLERLGDDVPGLPGPKFVFAHVIAPHGPYVFDAHGNPVRNPDPVSGYRDQVEFLNEMLRRAVDNIFQHSELAPVIILQADTGPGLALRWDAPPSVEVMWARMTIFNAFHLPEGSREGVLEELSPVNTFRLVLNRVYGTQMDLLPDRSYYSVWDHPYDFQDVTDEVRGYAEGGYPDVAP